MSFNLKTYKCVRIRHYFKKVNFFFFYHGTCLNEASWIKIKQILSKEELKYLRAVNTLIVKSVKNSIFKNLTFIVQGPIMLLHTSKTKLVLKKLDSLNAWTSFLCLKLNNKLYSKRQITNLKELSYFENMCLFYNCIKFLVRMPYNNLKNKKTIQISK